MFSMIAYNHLYHLKDYASLTKEYDWYKSKGRNSTPSLVYRSISELKNKFKNITKSPKQRGIPDHRNIRKSFTKKPSTPVISKSERNNNIEISIKVPFGKNRKFAKTSFNANDLDQETLIAKIFTLHDKITANTASNAIQLE